MPKKEEVEKANHEEHDDDDGFGKVIRVNKQLFIFGEINANSVGHFMAMFKEADSTPGYITVNVCSMGGWVEGGLTMWDVIKSSQNEVYTVACGAVYSSAILPFEAGDVRLIYNSSRLFFHDMSVSIPEGTRKTIESITYETNRLYDMYCGYVAERSKLQPKNINQLCVEEKYLDAKECKELGLADIVIPYTEKKYVAPTKAATTKKKVKAKNG